MLAGGWCQDKLILQSNTTTPITSDLSLQFTAAISILRLVQALILSRFSEMLLESQVVNAIQIAKLQS